MSGDFPAGSFLEKVFNKKANSSCSTKITNESCAARITEEPACPNVTISLVFRELQKHCTLRNPIKQVDRSSREEVTHTHLDPEGLCAPRKAKKTALHLRKKIENPEKLKKMQVLKKLKKLKKLENCTASRPGRPACPEKSKAAPTCVSAAISSAAAAQLSSARPGHMFRGYPEGGRTV